MGKAPYEPARRPRVRPPALGLLLVAVVAVAAPAASAPLAEGKLTLTAGTPRTGWIALSVSHGIPGSLVIVRERGTVVTRLRLDHRGRATAARAVPWRCDRQVRDFLADDGAAGTAIAHATTPSCARRLALRTNPRHPRAGHALAVRVVDRWHLGRLGVRVCLAPGVGRPRCTPRRLEPNGANVDLRAPRPGHWTLRAVGRDVTAARPLQVLPYGRRLSVLAIGDSLVENVASNLTRLLQGIAQVRTDMLLGAGISQQIVLDWIPHTRRMERRLRPDVVVVFIGGNEGFPFGSIGCCGRPWIGEFARRVRSVMRNFGRRGAAQVYWLSLPAPRLAGHRRTWRVEDIAFPRAARGLGPWTQVLDMSAIFTPGFVYRDAMPIDGQLTTVRESDGIHLNDAGGAVAAQAVVQAMRTDGVVSGG